MINKNILSKTRRDLIRINTLAVGVLFFIFIIFIYFYFNNLTYKKIDIALNRQYDFIIKQLEYKEVRNRPNNIRGYIVYVWNGNSLIDTGEMRGHLRESIETIRPYNYKDKVADGISSYFYNGYYFRELKKTSGDYTIEIIKRVDIEVDLLKQLRFVLIISGIIFSGSVYLVSCFLTKRTLQPIKSSWENQILFVQDASHELRTPLTIIFAKLESIMTRPKSTVEDEINNLSIIMKESRSLRKIISDLLKLTKEDSIVKVNYSRFDIVELVEAIIDEYVDLIAMQNKEIISENRLKHNNFIYSDEEKIRQLIAIFIDNAVKYTSSKDIIKIKLQDVKGYLRIDISDSGIGISEDEVNHIFNRFYRSPKSRKSNIEGSGIGLSIAKTIISNLNGRIEVDSKLGKGSCFYIYIPNKKT
ncbi:sensor histidine kinase [Romboutsia weinsteinii]|uniref:histidine kinase n=1 Tax=Romboutsia weinsteinii TaxID=2020949 RepID=A0A371J8W6_9FIRM|nr:HAMP domain-containing sensor histidine kinase [Romboutsia weinsteinii]RDY29117.1 sensor histidine kinase [Romboutsia weinsteinii]